MTLAEFMVEWGNAITEQGHSTRLGQSLFNTLYDYRKDLAIRIATTKCDPFYDDANISNCLNWLLANWE